MYQIYRGDAENRIEELHHGLEIDGTSCTGFLANPLRVRMTAAAYVSNPRNGSLYVIPKQVNIQG